MTGSPDVPRAYSAASAPVREDIIAAHSAFWRRLAAAGTWWSGAARVAIAAEARRAATCALCVRRKAALSPYGVDGEHDTTGELAEHLPAAVPDAVIDLIHRVATDAGRLSKRWFDSVMAAGVTDAAYVEVAAVVAKVVSTDVFCRALGVPVHPLPEPASGHPTGYRPPGARPGLAWVPTIPPFLATGADADIYPGGAAPNIARALSLVPDEARCLHELCDVLYFPMVQVTDLSRERALTRVQIELLAARVSALNECFY